MAVNKEGMLRDRPLWIRKGPLELAHPTRYLLGNERSLLIYPYNGALKEQGVRALRAALEGGEEDRGLEGAYAK